MSVSVSF